MWKQPVKKCTHTKSLQKCEYLKSLLGCSKKDPYPTHRENFRRPERGGRDCLKNVLNLYRMSREGRGVLPISPMGVAWIFSGTTHFEPCEIESKIYNLTACLVLFIFWITRWLFSLEFVSFFYYDSQGWVDYKSFVVRYNYSYFKNM